MEENGNALIPDVANGKQIIASAITEKGVFTKSTDSYQTMANNIKQIYKGSYDESFKVIIDDTLPSPEVTRVGLVNSINYEKAEGNSITNLWYEGIKYTLNIDTALVMLKQLELYALECYNTTQTHIANISKLKTVEEVKSYNYKTGYPSILNFKAG